MNANQNNRVYISTKQNENDLNMLEINNYDYLR